METPIPIPPQNPPPSGWQPTASTNLSVLAGAVTTVASAVAAHFGFIMDGMTQGALTVVVMALVNYIHPDGGRK